MDETPEEARNRIAEANTAFAENENRAKVHAAQIQTFSSDAMKAPALVSAAGVAAALGFYSANFARLDSKPDGLDTFNSILFWLFTSLLLTVCAPGFAYFSQSAYIGALYQKTHSYLPPYLSDNWKTRLFAMVGDVCRWFAVLLVAAAIGCLMRGGALFLHIVA